MADKRIPDVLAFDHLDKLLAQFHPVRQPDSFYMTEAMRDKIAEAVKPMLVAKAETRGFSYAGMEIYSYPAGIIVLNTKTGERATIDDNSVLSVIRADCVIIPAGRAALEPRDAPAAMPGERELADEIEREMMSWRGADGGVFTLRACAFAIAQKVSCFSAPILAEKERLAGIADAYATCESVARKRVDHIDPALEERLPALCEISRETWLAHKERAPIMAVDMLEHAKRKALEARALAAEAALAAERERVAKVLEPFDDALGEDDEGYGDGLTVVMKWGACTDYSVTLADLRDVRKLASAIRAQE